MKRLILLTAIISLVACKKKEAEPETNTPTNPITSTSSKTISVICQTACTGTLNVCWDYKWNTFVTDSSYTYTNNTFTKVVSGDSMYVHFTSSNGTMTCNSDVTVTVNGITKATYNNNQTQLYYFLKL